MARERPALQYESAGNTHTGLVREHNEDSFAVRNDLGLFVVADGMARCAGGAMASSLATHAIPQRFERSRARLPLDPSRPEIERERLVHAIRSANYRIADAAQRHPEHRRMATTVAALAVVGRRAVLAHVGDSRVYRLRRDSLERLTMDHSVAEDLEFRAANAGSPELTDPKKQALMTEILGRREPFKIATRIEPIQRGDQLLLCTDGLSGVLWDDWIHLALKKYRKAPKPPEMVLTTVAEKKAWALIRLTLNRGAGDNVTVIVLRFPY